MINTNFIAQHAKEIFDVTPIEYLKDIKLRGELFEDNCTSGAVSCVNTEFYVGHWMHWVFINRPRVGAWGSCLMDTNF